MHDSSILGAVYSDIIASVKGKVLTDIGKKYNVKPATIYLWKKKFQSLARTIPEMLRRDDCKEGGESVAARITEEVKPEEPNPVHAEEPADLPLEKIPGRKKGEYYSLPIVAKKLGKSVRDMRQIIRDHGIKPDTILVKRRNRDVLGYSEDTIERMRNYESNELDSVELREILGLNPSTYQLFLEFAAKLFSEELYATKFSAINDVFQHHKKNHSYRFERTMVPVLQRAKNEFIKGRRT